MTKKYTGVTFHFGGLLDDTNRLLTKGSSNFLRSLNYSDPHDVDAAVVLDFIRCAIGEYPYFRENWKELR